MGVAGTGSLCYTLLMTLSFGEDKPMYMLLHGGGGGGGEGLHGNHHTIPLMELPTKNKCAMGLISNN